MLEIAGIEIGIRAMFRAKAISKASFEIRVRELAAKKLLLLKGAFKRTPDSSLLPEITGGGF